MNFDEELKALSERVLSKALTEEEKNKYTETVFESIKHTNEFGQEYWYARELQFALEYKSWDKFKNVINKAIAACNNSENNSEDHFSHVGNMVNIGSGAAREIENIELSRYACYLIVMSADESKKIIALGKSYFAIKARQQELIEHYDDLNEDQKRLATRGEMISHNKSLAEAAGLAGVIDPKDYAIFQNKGYNGLYGGMGRKEIHAKKGLKKNQTILDHMGSTELAANLFRATQTDEKLRRDNIAGKENAYKTHFNVGKEVRDTIGRLGGTMPEDLPTPEKSIKQIEREQKRL